MKKFKLNSISNQKVPSMEINNYHIKFDMQLIKNYMLSEKQKLKFLNNFYLFEIYISLFKNKIIFNKLFDNFEIYINNELSFFYKNKIEIELTNEIFFSIKIKNVNIKFSITLFEDEEQKVEEDILTNDENEIKYENKFNKENYCHIACHEFEEEEIAILNPCNHSFCKDCILEGMEYFTNCPLCKQEISSIRYKDPVLNCDIDYKVNKNVIKPKEEEIFIDPIENADDYCYFCLKKNNYNFMWVCDFCNQKCLHTFCFENSSFFIPEIDKWYCDFCHKNNFINEELVEKSTLSNIFNKERRQKYLEKKIIFKTRNKSKNLKSFKIIKKLKKYYNNLN